jgi:hypothetical protein
MTELRPLEQARQDLQIRIANNIKNFEKDTGLWITSVNLFRGPTSGDGFSTLDIKVEAVL